MALAPFGALSREHDERIKFEKDIFSPVKKWKKSENEYDGLLRKWLNDVEENIWPACVDGAWKGLAEKDIEKNSRAELELAVRLYHGSSGSKDILNEAPKAPAAPDGKVRTHEWHYKIEDALVLDAKYLYLDLKTGEDLSYDFRASRNNGSNYIVYDPVDQGARFEALFFAQMNDIEPATLRIKLHFQRPRPWAAAAALEVQGFRWVVAGGDFFTHTGTHPSLLSGHCLQGILGGCSAYDAMLSDNDRMSDERLGAMKQYIVDFGDRRVFAGVHYMTDNIASWTLARRMIPYLFEHPEKVEAFAVQAITQYSRVFADVIAHFDEASPARKMLLRDFPEAETV